MTQTLGSDGPLVVVVSHIWIGHIPWYHRLIVERAERIGGRVVSITPDGKELPRAARSRPYVLGKTVPGDKKEDAVAGNRVERRGFLTRLRKSRFQSWTGILTMVAARRNWQMLAAILREVAQEENRPIDLAFLVYLGLGFLEPGVSSSFIEKNMPCPWGGIWNGPKPGREQGDPLIGIIWPREAPLRAGNSRVVWVPHPSLAERLRSYRLAAIVEAMPEIADLEPPAPNSVDAKRVRSIAAGRRVIGLLGSISLRKGILTLIEAAWIAAIDAPDLFFFAAGEFSPATCGDEFGEISAATAASPANFLFLPGRISDGPEFNAFVSAVDVLYAVYRDFPFQSNLLTKAAHFRKPILVAPGEVMASCTREFDLGEVVAPDDPHSVLAGIRSVLAGRKVDGQRWRPRFEEYSSMNGASLLDDLIASAVGGSAGAGRIPMIK